MLESIIRLMVILRPRKNIFDHQQLLYGLLQALNYEIVIYLPTIHPTSTSISRKEVNVLLIINSRSSSQPDILESKNRIVYQSSILMFTYEKMKIKKKFNQKYFFFLGSATIDQKNGSTKSNKTNNNDGEVNRNDENGDGKNGKKKSGPGGPLLQQA